MQITLILENVHTVYGFRMP